MEELKCPKCGSIDLEDEDEYCDYVEFTCNECGCNFRVYIDGIKILNDY